MRTMYLTFLTMKGEEAYHKINKIGESQGVENKVVMRRIVREVVLNKTNPLEIRIDIKIPRLAQDIGLLGLTEESLKKEGLVNNEDYIIKVE